MTGEHRNAKETNFILGGKITAISNISSKQIYLQFLKSEGNMPVVIDRLRIQYDFSCKEIENIFLRLRQCTLNSRLREFQFKLLHGIYTNHHLFRFRFVSDNLCSFGRKEEETYQHIFYTCEYAQTIWERCRGIIDYVDLLGTKKKTSDRKGEIDDIYQSTKGLARQLDVPIWSVSQVNRAGAKDDIVEGDKAAGSYDKIMITDVCISLSRKKADKVNGTGRFHIMKNRYGIDGLTFGVEADTSTGHFILKDYNPDDYEKEPVQSTTTNYGEVDQYDKKQLANQFFTLNK